MGKSEIIIIIIIFNLFFILFIAGIVIFIREYKLKKKEHSVMLLHQKSAHQKELLTTQVEIQEQTMQHIGREIHDNIGQKLTLASLYMQQLAFESKSPKIKDNIENINNIINQSLEELRELSKSLTDNIIETSSIYKLLNTEYLKINELKIFKIDFNCTNKKLALPYQLKTILVRITQEFIQNSIKHSRCKLITIELEELENKIMLTLVDDGIGFDISKIHANGIGISNMKKRTEMLGGNFDLKSNPKTGTQLSITFSL
ncbi:two-component sensor histidine kinase [Flavobacterium cheongpyeongense]|jgi:signal transduction histidine kinase|uniref:histidine kinase n=2 Tax=Flavobacterium cheongpyeongense TaxID=2212651 RepID=A0A2V4BMI5_9FLAO|nr:two-component sensor histidine kinase [Flavobacterium cheongpyeongense]